ncbi:MAG: hypothetical protein IPG71_14075 [bacterium]|nr:hypothetical protein [bacterium]
MSTVFKSLGSSLVFWSAVTAALFALYWPCLSLPPAGDDWLLIHPAQTLARKHGIVGAIFGAFAEPVFAFYRPLPLVPSVLVKQDFVLFQVLKILLTVWLGYTVYRTAKGLDLSEHWSRLLASVVILHQVFASVITEVDL